MAVFDVREEQQEEIDEIVFSDEEIDGYRLAYEIRENDGRIGSVAICDMMEYVVIHNRQHALNLIKALNKAIELGWLKD